MSDDMFGKKNQHDPSTKKKHNSEQVVVLPMCIHISRTDKWNRLRIKWKAISRKK